MSAATKLWHSRWWSPKEIVLGWGDDTHILVAATRTLPCAIQSVSVQDGTRSAAFVMPGLGHEGAQLGPRAMAVLGGKAYAASYSEPRSKLYLVDGLR